MVENIVKLSEYERLFLLSLLEDGRKSDTRIAEETGMSLPSANRIRKKLEREGLIFKYIPVIALDKIGIKFFVAVLFRWKGYTNEKLTEEMFIDLEEDPRVVFFATGEGSGLTTMLFLGFSELSEAHEYFNEFRKKYEEQLGDMIPFFIPFEGFLKQDYTDIIKKKITEEQD